MKKITLMGLGTIALLIFTGCTQPSFNPNSKKIVFVEGKPYYIPHNTKNMEKSLSTKNAKEANEVGGKCKKGDVMWVAYAAKSLINKPNLTPEETKATYIKINQAGLTGCASPLSKQEYQYRLSQEHQYNLDEKEAKKRRQKNVDDVTNSINNVTKNNIEMMKAMNQPSVVYVY